MKDELGGKFMTKNHDKICWIKSYLRDDSSQDKKAKDIKKCVIKRKLKFKNYKNCLEATQLEIKTKLYRNNKIDIDSIKEFIKNNGSISKLKKRFKSERHNVFTEEISKIALSSNDDIRMQSIDSIETYAYGTSKDLVSEKEEIKCGNIIKRCKND